MLPYYAARFPTVEINYTFYRMPNETLVAGWAAQTPAPYKLTLKAPRRITHDNRLKNVGALVATFCQVAGTLGDKLGALLFPLPDERKAPSALRSSLRSSRPLPPLRRLRARLRSELGIRRAADRARQLLRQREPRIRDGRPGALVSIDRAAVRPAAGAARLRHLRSGLERVRSRPRDRAHRQSDSLHRQSRFGLRRRSGVR